MTSPVVTGTGYKSGIFYNFPNPFNPNKQSTRIIYGIEKQSKISLRIYNIRGELIRELIPQQEITIPGRYGIDWDGRNDSNQMVASGVYICCLVINDKPYTRKIALIK
jgi:flagellar hook assembly protein FlgD